LSEEELQALLVEWQERLRLQDWRLTVQFARYHELGEGKAGNIEWNIERRGARIKVLAEADVAPDGLIVNPEHVLVHELLHILWCHYDADGVENTLFEQALNTTADALVALKREAHVEMEPEPQAKGELGVRLCEEAPIAPRELR